MSETFSSKSSKPDILDKKKTARQSAQGLISALDKNRRRLAALSACANLKASDYWKKARTVLAYLAFGSELNADPVIQAALDTGKFVYVPKVFEHLMTFHRITSLNSSFEKGIFGIREPSSMMAVWDNISAPEPTLVLVPGLVFDKKGSRLGRGGGYYDRFISKARMEARKAGAKAPLFIGYAYQEQIFSEVPCNDFDESIDGLITDGFFELF